MDWGGFPSLQRVNMNELVLIAFIGALFTFLGIIFPVIFKKINSIKTIVNGGYGDSLKVGAMALRKIADSSGKEEDIAAALYAENLLKTHEAELLKIDAK